MLEKLGLGEEVFKKFELLFEQSDTIEGIV